MRMRSLLVAASAAALIGTTSFGALAGYHGKSISKGEATAWLKVTAYSDNPRTSTWGDPKVTLEINLWNEAKAPPHGSAGASADAGGGGKADTITGQNNNGPPLTEYEPGTQETHHAEVNGDAHVTACAGYAC